MKRVLLAAALALTAATAGTTAATARTLEPEGSPAPETTTMPEETTPEETTPDETGMPEETTPGETGEPGAPGGPMSTPTGEATPGATTSPMGPGCAALKDSISGVADQPAGTALTKIPDLSKLSEAVKAAGLEEKLNSAKDVTIFAPNDAAFTAVPKDVQDAMSDKATATKILSYHVVEGKVSPADLKDGDMLKTLQGGELTVKGTGEDMTINDAKIVCGGIPTSNATLYVIDKVLMPQ
ncbi:Immunogenic protein MPT70 precursor [Nonomuraea coxensis DSM 45129]|uniref:Immunogenic protein MPT70 n=1 Tax=Nonomuraea coxensis DSM 45129 TaxID=1122611 RepID=A0ABX8U4F1_9ACTN|nr:fasciclin domain-containing protein [Nonomuraea coxensis]QYC41624.1 Immunogenic protein MPT70 precursor [Nonomuraea coxensis DSM 45129]